MGIDKAYEEKAEAKARESNAKMEFVKARATMLKADLKIGLYQRLEKLRDRVVGLRDELEAVNEAGESAWQAWKRTFEDAWEDFRLGFEAAVKTLEEGGPEIPEAPIPPEPEEVEKK